MGTTLPDRASVRCHAAWPLVFHTFLYKQISAADEKLSQFVLNSANKKYSTISTYRVYRYFMFSDVVARERAKRRTREARSINIQRNQLYQELNYYLNHSKVLQKIEVKLNVSGGAAPCPSSHSFAPCHYLHFSLALWSLSSSYLSLSSFPENQNDLSSSPHQ